jgi:hypothetical protein
MRILAALLVVFSIASDARADMVWHDAYKSPFSSWGAYMYDQNVKRHLAKRTPAATAAAPLTATDFRRSAKRKDVVAQLVTSSKLSPADAQQLATTLRATMAQLESAGRRDNVGSAMAIVLALSFVVLEAPDFDVAKADALVGTANDALAASPMFRKLGAAERQLMYDSLLLSAAVIAIVHQSGDKTASQAIAKQVVQQLVGVTP